MIITVYTDPKNTKELNLDRDSINLRNMFPSIHRIGNTTISGTIVEDVTTFTSEGEFSPETLVDGLIERYGEGDVFDTCEHNDQPRRISVLQVDDQDRIRKDIPKDIYSGSEYIYIIKPDRMRLETELVTKVVKLFSK